MRLQTALKLHEHGGQRSGAKPAARIHSGAQLRVVASDRYVQPKSDAAYTWLCHAINGEDAPMCRGMRVEDAKDGRIRMRAKDGSAICVWKVDSHLLTQLKAAQDKDHAIVFRAYRPLVDSGDPPRLERITHKKGDPPGF